MAASTKRYYWLKLKDDFFRSKAMKKLRKIAGGDTYTIIYLKMMLNSITNGGMLYYDGVEDDFCDELALDLDEDVENVKMTVAFLTAQGLLEQKKVDEFFLPEASDSIGSETTAAARMRKSRENRKEAIECNNVTPMLQDVPNGYTEKDIDIEKDIELDTEKKQPDKPADRVSYQEIVDLYHNICKSYPILRSMPEKRKKAIKARARVHPIEDFHRVFEIAESSDFLKGANSHDWSATFDWMMKDANFTKILEGNYGGVRNHGAGRDGITTDFGETVI